jgi:hypothetical protein
MNRLRNIQTQIKRNEKHKQPRLANLVDTSLYGLHCDVYKRVMQYRATGNALKNI